MLNVIAKYILVIVFKIYKKKSIFLCVFRGGFFFS